MNLQELMEKNRGLLAKVNTLDENASPRQVAFTEGLLIEEMSELTKELMKIHNRGKDRREQAIEELADVILLIDQCVRFIDPQELQKWLQFKGNRYLERYGNGRS